MMGQIIKIGQPNYILSGGYAICSFDGFGIGGSFEKEDMEKAVEWVNNILPKEKPRHLIGIGEPMDLFMAVEKGCDLFDCVSPTRIARNGGVYTKNGKINFSIISGFNFSSNSAG